MVSGKARDMRITQKIHPAIAHMGKMKLTATNHYRGAGCSHPVKFGMLYGIRLNALVSSGERFHQSCLRIVSYNFVIPFADCLNCEATCLLAAFVSAHAVGYNCQSSLALEFTIIRGSQ